MTARETQEPSSHAASQAVVRESEKLLAHQASIPDGPNVAPSPLEHLAAQGQVTGPEGAKSGATPSGTGTVTPPGAPRPSSELPPAESSAGDAPVEPVDPAEQALVDEQLGRDREAAQHTQAPSSGG